MGATRRLKTMRAILQKIVEETPGARGAIIMGYDGIVIERYKARGSEDFDIDAFTDGMDGVPLGDIRVLGAGVFAGSPGKLDGWLLSMFHADKAVDTSLDIADVGPLADAILGFHGLPKKMVRAGGAHAELRFTGLFTDPTIGVSANAASYSRLARAGWSSRS